MEFDVQGQQLCRWVSIYCRSTELGTFCCLTRVICVICYCCLYCNTLFSFELSRCIEAASFRAMVTTGFCVLDCYDML